EELDDFGIAQEPLQIGRRKAAGREQDHVCRAIARGKLRQAQTIPIRIKPQGLAVDGDDGAKIEPIRKVVLMERDFHGTSIVSDEPIEKWARILSGASSRGLSTQARGQKWWHPRSAPKNWPFSLMPT